MEHLDERVSSRESYLGHFKSYGMDGAESAYFTSVYKTWSHPQDEQKDAARGTLPWSSLKHHKCLGVGELHRGGSEELGRKTESAPPFSLEGAPIVSFTKYFQRVKAIISVERKKTCELKTRFSVRQRDFNLKRRKLCKKIRFFSQLSDIVIS